MTELRCIWWTTLVMTAVWLGIAGSPWWLALVAASLNLYLAVRAYRDWQLESEATIWLANNQESIVDLLVTAMVIHRCSQKIQGRPVTSSEGL